MLLAYLNIFGMGIKINLNKIYLTAVAVSGFCSCVVLVLVYAEPLLWLAINLPTTDYRRDSWIGGTEIYLIYRETRDRE